MDAPPPDRPEPSGPAGPDAGASSGPQVPPFPLPPRLRRAAWGLAGVMAVALAFGAWGLWRVVAPAGEDVQARLQASETAREGLEARVDDLSQQVATLGRSDQISRDANLDLQRTLAERDEEIAGLRADVAFYERLVGATAQRRGLSVHAIRFEPMGDTAWHFTSTLTQNLNRGAVSRGVLRVAIEGTRDGKREVLSWALLRQDEGAPGVAYSFKYFQQVEDDIFLPEGFEPVRVRVQLQPESGRALEQGFTWADATRGSPPNAETGAEADTGAAPEPG